MDHNVPEKPYKTIKMETKIRPSRPKPTVDLRHSLAKNALFTQEEEDELAGYIVELQKIVLRLTINDVINLANQVAEQHRKKLTFRNNSITAERFWVLNLMKRYPNIILRIPDKYPTPTEFNIAELEYFYKSLGEVYNIKKIPPNRIYNADYIKIFLGKNNTYIINRSGNTGRVNSDGIIITVKVCFSADGHYMPSMMILSENQRSDVMNNDAQGAWKIFTDKGSFTNELFLQWFQRFIYFSGAEKNQQVLLLFDGQPAYTKNIEIVKMTKKNGVNIISFLLCTTNRLQPLNEVFVSDLSKTYNEVVEAWMRSNPGNSITLNHVEELFGKTLSQAATAIAAVEAFKRCGIYPLDTNMFTESDFLPVSNTKVQVNKDKTPPPTNTIQKSFDTSSKYYFDLYYNPRPGCSFWPD